jgi:hypothetical protein
MGILMKIQVNDVAKYGIVNDTPDSELPLEAWSAGQNVRFHDGKVIKFKGHSQTFGTPSVAPYFAMPVPTDTTYYWLYASLAKVYVTDGTTHTNITRQTSAVDVDYSATANYNWTGGVLGQVPIINNGVDDPQMWNPISTSTKLASLTFDATYTWNDKSYTVRSLRTFGQFGIGLFFNDGSNEYPSMVMWSDPAAPGSEPATWDWTDATSLAGRYEIAQTPGACVDSLPLGQTNVIYKDDSAWGMQLINGNDVFRFFEIFRQDGILSRRCMIPFKGRHLVVTTGDVVVHAASQPESILTNRMRKWLFNNIDSTNYSRAFVTAVYPKDEIWICFPQTGSSFPDLALVWNFRDNTFGVRDLPNTAHISFGVIDPNSSNTWSGSTDTWTTITGTWGEKSYNPANLNPLILDHTNTKMYLGDDTNQFAGSNMTSYVEKTGLSLGDPARKKMITRIRPRITGTPGGVVQVRVGARTTPDGPVTWTTNNFTIGTTEKIDIRVNDFYHALRFSSNTDVEWSLLGYEIEYVDRGGR